MKSIDKVVYICDLNNSQLRTSRKIWHSIIAAACLKADTVGWKKLWNHTLDQELLRCEL